MREARSALKLNQVEFHDKYVGSERVKLRTYQRAEAGANEAGMMLIESFARAGINTNWLLTGEGDMLLKDGQRAAAEMPWQAIPDAVRYSSLMEPGHSNPAPVVDIRLLAQCIDACLVVYGRDFTGLDVADQVAYGGDLYNRLVRMAESSRSAGAQAALHLLDVAGIADQLRLFVKMGMAKQFRPNQKAQKPDAA